MKEREKQEIEKRERILKKKETRHAWWESAIAYQIYPRSFQDSNGDGIGDLRGIINRLPYLESLGIDLIWICPIYPSPNDDNGYDISDYHGIQEEYGTMQDFEELLEKAHEKKIRVIMDLVINHTSSSHPWFLEARSSKESEKRDWYIWREGGEEGAPNNWESIFGGSAWELDQETDQYYLHVFGKTMPDLNWENQQLKKVLYEMIRWWIEKGIDGFRLDAISHIHKPDLSNMPNPKGKKYVSSFDKHMNQEGILNYLQELQKETFDQYDIFTIAEANGVRIDEVQEWISRDQGVFHSLFQFEHLNLWNRDTSTERIPLKKIKKALSKWQEATRESGMIGLVMENHDLVRSVSKYGDCGTYWKESAKCLALMLFMQKGIPFLYQGQEIGMLNADFASVEEFRDEPPIASYQKRIKKGMSEGKSLSILKSTTRDNCRTPMQWDTSDNAGFSTGNPWIGVNGNYTWLNVEKQEQDADSILHFYRKMIQLRKEKQALCYGTYQLYFENSETIYAYERAYQGERYFILCNLSRDKELVKLPFDHNNAVILLSNYLEKATEELRPYECRCYDLGSTS